MKILHSAKINRQNRVAGVFGVIGVIFGLHPLLARSATTSVGDYATLMNVIAASADGDTIILTNNITVSAEIAINGKGLTIKGNNFSISVPVPGLNASGVTNASPSAFRVFDINAGGKTNTLLSMTVMGGAPSGTGGGILNTSGTLVLQGVTVAQSGGPSYGGGGLANSSGALYLADCNISRNAAKYGGGFLNSGSAQMFIERCTFSENRSLVSGNGGGAGENQSMLYANNSTFANNISTELGGAINHNTGGTAYFVDCTFVGNVAYGSAFMGGAIANNTGYLTLVNSLIAYNYHFNGSTFDLNDITNYNSGPSPVSYYSVFQSATNQLGGSSLGTTLYTGDISGSNNTLFCAGATTQVLGPGGNQIGSSTVYQPFLAKVGSSQTPTAVLQPGSFALGKGVRAAFSSATATPVVGYYNGSSWVALSGSNPAAYEITTDQDGIGRGSSLTVGAVNSTASGLFMLKVNAATNGSVSGGTVYGDNYPSGTTVTLTAIPAPGYAFSQWTYALGGSGIASTANPFAITLTTNVTLVPVFTLYTGFTITYSGDGFTGGTVPSQQVVSSGGSTNISGAGTMVRSLYTFSCWDTRSDGNGTDYAANAAYNGPTNLNLYAKWTLIPGPTITTPPASQVVATNAPVTLSVSVTGTAPMSYQWFNNGGMVVNATNSSLTFASAGVTNSGIYYVAVTNAYGLSISLPATVLVGTPQLMGWGDNTSGELGDGTTASRDLPESVGSNVVIAAVGGNHSLFLKGDGSLWAMGDNTYGQLGDGTTTERNSPVAVASNVVALAAGGSHSLYLKSDGTLWAMGDNTYGQLGDGTTINRSNAVPIASNVVAVAAGNDHSIYLRADGSAWTMGFNAAGQLGNGTTTQQNNAVSVISNVVAVAAGYNHSLFLKSDGSVWGVGQNTQGELGDGTTTSPSSPESVASNVVAVAAGGGHSLFLKPDGTMWVTGYNANGQLGNGNITDQHSPVSVASNVATMAGGSTYSAYLKNDGTLWATGDNFAGQLGDGTTTSRSNAVNITGLSLAGVFAGEAGFHTLAVGVAPMPAITSQPISQTVVATSNVTFTVAATGFAPLSYQWYFDGNLVGGATATNYSLTGAMMTNAGNYTVVVSNSIGSLTSSVAVLTVNKAYATLSPWPTATPITLGQTLASSTLSGGSSSVPGIFAFLTPAAVLVATASEWVSFTPTDTTDYYTVELTISVTVLSPPSFTTSPTNQVVPVGGPVNLSVTPSGTGPFSFQWFKNGGMVLGATNGALTFSGAGVTNAGTYCVVVTNAYGMSISQPATVTVGAPQLLAWGGNNYSQLGDGTTANKCLPESVASNVAVASAGADHSLFLKGDGTLWGVGYNGDGELGDGTTLTRSNAVSVASNVVAVAGAVWHSLFVKADGTLWAMGQNLYGQLGDGTTSSRSNAVSVASNVVAVAGGNDDSLFLKADGTLWAMGQNGNGQLGDGTTTDRHLPVSVASNVVVAAAGYAHSLFLKNDGTLWAMGQNSFGQLGDGTTTDQHSPVSVASNVVAAAAGYYHSLFLKNDGTLWAMGYNWFGQLGDGTTTDQHSPVSVGSNVVAVAAGYAHSLFLKNDGTLWAMGQNIYGQLGDGTWTQRNSPVSVPGMSLANVVSGNTASHTLAVGVPLAPAMVGITNNNNGTVTATFQGIVGATYLVFASTNLVAPSSWSAVATNQAGNVGIWPYTEATAGWQQRFFRAAVAP